MYISRGGKCYLIGKKASLKHRCGSQITKLWIKILVYFSESKHSANWPKKVGSNDERYIRILVHKRDEKGVTKQKISLKHSNYHMSESIKSWRLQFSGLILLRPYTTVMLNYHCVSGQTNEYKQLKSKLNETEWFGKEEDWEDCKLRT